MMCKQCLKYMFSNQFDNYNKFLLKDNIQFNIKHIYYYLHHNLNKHLGYSLYKLKKKVHNREHMLNKLIHHFDIHSNVNLDKENIESQHIYIHLNRSNNCNQLNHMFHNLFIDIIYKLQKIAYNKLQIQNSIMSIFQYYLSQSYNYQYWLHINFIFYKIYY